MNRLQNVVVLLFRREYDLFKLTVARDCFGLYSQIVLTEHAFRPDGKRVYTRGDYQRIRHQEYKNQHFLHKSYYISDNNLDGSIKQ